MNRPRWGLWSGNISTILRTIHHSKERANKYATEYVPRPAPKQMLLKIIPVHQCEMRMNWKEASQHTAIITCPYFYTLLKKSIGIPKATLNGPKQIMNAQYSNLEHLITRNVSENAIYQLPPDQYYVMSTLKCYLGREGCVPLALLFYHRMAGAQAGTTSK